MDTGAVNPLEELAQLCEKEPDLELLAKPVLSVVNLRCAPEKLRSRPDALDDLNKRVMESLQSDGKVFLTGTQIRGRFSLRACILHYATREEDLDLLVERVSATGRFLSF